MGRVWFTSDTHLNHKKIISYCGRPFESVEEMNETLINNWNQTVKKNDTVYHLGDFGFFKDFLEFEKIVSHLNGRIKLIKGNHDYKSNSFYRDCGFVEVYDTPIIYKEFLVLSHEPQPFIISRGGPIVNVFGHIHDSPEFKTWGSNHCCVCVERHNYRPISFEEIANHFN